MTQPSDFGTAPHFAFVRAAAHASWGWTVARGVLTLIFGVLALTWPSTAILSLVLVFGIYALLDGGTALVMGLTSRAGGVRWPLILSGVLGLLAGVVTFFNPGSTLLALLWLVAAWALIRGVLEVMAAIRWRAEIPGAGEWLMGLGGLLLVLLGVMLLLNPVVATLSITFLIGGYAIIGGLVLIVLGFQLKNLTPYSDA